MDTKTIYILHIYAIEKKKNEDIFMSKSCEHFTSVCYVLEKFTIILGSNGMKNERFLECLRFERERKIPLHMT